MSTATQLLIQDRLPGRPNVLEWIRAQRDAGRSFEQVARRIEVLTEVEVTAETVRNWVRNGETSPT
jgi:hypothetical protein